MFKLFNYLEFFCDACSTSWYSILNIENKTNKFWELCVDRNNNSKYSHLPDSPPHSTPARGHCRTPSLAMLGHKSSRWSSWCGTSCPSPDTPDLPRSPSPHTCDRYLRYHVTYNILFKVTWLSTINRDSMKIDNTNSSMRQILSNSLEMYLTHNLTNSTTRQIVWHKTSIIEAFPHFEHTKKSLNCIILHLVKNNRHYSWLFCS